MTGAAPSAPTAAQAEAFEGHLLEVNTSGTRAAAVLILVIAHIFAVLDRFIFQDHLIALLMLRLLQIVCAGGALGLTFTRIGRRNISLVSVALFCLTGLAIVVMIFLHEGYRSPYYAGLMLVILGSGVLMRWRQWECYVTYGVIYISYLVPCLLQEVGEIEVLISNNVFICTTVLIVCVAQHSGLRLLRSEFLGTLALAEAHGRLKEIDRLKSQFFSNITHELRTPLTMILSPLESLMDGELGRLNQAQRSYLQPIQRNGVKLLKLINDLLDLARIEERYMRLRVEQADLAALLREIVDYSRPLAARKELRLELELRCEEADLHIDPEKVERVMVNLISNALKFTEPGGRVTVAMEAGADREVLVSVEDTGIGITEEQLPWIFERFRQADGAVTRRFGGSGIGLSLAREIVGLHGGRISVQSRPGEGSRFTVHLSPGMDHLDEQVLDRRRPRDPAAPTERRRSDDHGPREWTRMLQERKAYRFLEIDEATERRVAVRGDDRKKATKVLIVEDNVEVLRFLQMQLREQHAVFLAQDGVKGLALARRERPDVIITDYMMPRMDGLTMLKELRAAPETADTPVIMLTAKNTVQDRLDVRSGGADIYISKPFSPTELRAGVRQLLERRGRQAAIMVREHVRSLEVISAGLAHEIHNPLSYIKNAVFVISEQVARIDAAARSGVGPDELKRLFDGSRDKIERMQEVARKGIERINEMVELVRRYAREGYPAEPSPMAVDDTIRGLARLITPHHDHVVDTELDLQAHGAEVLCIPEEMQQVIRNIWQNALDAVGASGRVKLRTWRAGDEVHLEVSDDGPGIARDDLTRIFTPFFTTKEPGQGLGLGLAIAHQVVEQTGGALSVQSVPGEGAAFSIKLPATKNVT